MMKTHKEFSPIEQTTLVSKTCSGKYGWIYNQSKGLDDDAWDLRTLSKVAWERFVLDALIPETTD